MMGLPVMHYDFTKVRVVCSGERGGGYHPPPLAPASEVSLRISYEVPGVIRVSSAEVSYEEVF